MKAGAQFWHEIDHFQIRWVIILTMIISVIGVSIGIRWLDSTAILKDIILSGDKIKKIDQATAVVIREIAAAGGLRCSTVQAWKWSDLRRSESEVNAALVEFAARGNRIVPVALGNGLHTGWRVFLVENDGRRSVLAWRSAPGEQTLVVCGTEWWRFLNPWIWMGVVAAVVGLLVGMASLWLTSRPLGLDALALMWPATTVLLLSLALYCFWPIV